MLFTLTFQLMVSKQPALQTRRTPRRAHFPHNEYRISNHAPKHIWEQMRAINSFNFARFKHVGHILHCICQQLIVDC